MATDKTVELLGSLRTRHSHVITKFGTKAAWYLGSPPASLTPLTLTSDAGGFATSQAQRQDYACHRASHQAAPARLRIDTTSPQGPTGTALKRGPALAVASIEARFAVAGRTRGLWGQLVLGHWACRERSPLVAAPDYGGRAPSFRLWIDSPTNDVDKGCRLSERCLGQFKRHRQDVVLGSVEVDLKACRRERNMADTKETAVLWIVGFDVAHIAVIVLKLALDQKIRRPITIPDRLK